MWRRNRFGSRLERFVAQYEASVPTVIRIGLDLALIAGLRTRGMATLTLGMFTLFARPDDPVLAHISLFRLSSALMITGSGPLAVDAWLRKRTGTDGSTGSQCAGVCAL
jgi:hypothetical protein